MKLFFEHSINSKNFNVRFNFFEPFRYGQKYNADNKSKNSFYLKSTPSKHPLCRENLSWHPLSFFSAIGYKRNSSKKLVYLFLLSLYSQAFSLQENVHYRNIHTNTYEYNNVIADSHVVTSSNEKNHKPISFHSIENKTNVYNLFFLLLIHLRRKDKIFNVNGTRRYSEITDLDRNESNARRELLLEIAPYFAHELSQPISSILLDSHYIESKLTTSPINEGILSATQNIINCANIAANIISNIREIINPNLNFIETIDLNEIAHSAYKIISPFALKSMVEFQFSESKNKILISGEKTLILQVLINLYKNSIEACAESQKKLVNVCIYMSNESPTIQIRDSGIGFNNPETTGKKFFTSKTGGIGLGLSLAHSIVKYHKGEINYQNSKEGGAIVTINFNRI